MTVKELLEQLADVDLRAPIIIRPFERKADEPLLARCGIRELRETRGGEIEIDVEEI